MKPKHLIILICIAVVLGIIYMAQQGKRKDAAGTAGSRELVPADFSSDNLAAVKLERGGKTVTLKQTGNGWAVEERYGYPADTAKLRELFVKLCDARIAQTLSLIPTQLEELSLTPEKATVMTLTDKNVKLLQRFVFGSEHGNRPDSAAPYGMGGGSGRYLQLADGRNVVVPERFGEVDASLTDWLNRDFFQVSDLKRAELRRNGKSEWVLTFKDGKPVLSGGIPANKELDETKASALKSAYSWIRFSDVADPKAAPGTTGMDKAPELLLTDGDDLVYTVRPGAGADDNYFLRVSVAWKGEAKRTAPAGEKPEDKKRLDAEFAQTVKERQEKAAKLDKALSPWTYQVEKSVFDVSAGTRDGFLKAKAKTEAPPATDPK